MRLHTQHFVGGLMQREGGMNESKSYVTDVSSERGDGVAGAQEVERVVYMERVGGSIPNSSGLHTEQTRQTSQETELVCQSATDGCCV